MMQPLLTFLRGSALALLATGAALAQTTNFAYTGATQTYTVPANVTSIQVVATGGAGGVPNGNGYALGATVTTTLTVVPGEVLTVRVGGRGANGANGTNAGGYNGGASGVGAGGGGGATDLLRASAGGSTGDYNTTRNALLVAAGAGGSDNGSSGGAGGTPTGGTAAGGGAPGTGATQAGPGNGFIPGSGGTGGNGHPTGGGGGGGGYYGGGGGGDDTFFGGGGGGSSWASPTASTTPVYTVAGGAANGALTITVAPPNLTAVTRNPGGLGQSITLTGTNLGSPTAFTINGATVPAANIISNNGTTLVVRVPLTATATGNISLTNANGTDTLPFTVMTPPGNALAFDGTDDYVNGTNALLPQGNSARTLEAWVNPSNTNCGLFIYGTNANNQRAGLSLLGNRLYYAGYLNDLIGNTTLTAGRWYHVAATFDGTTLKLYVNGVLDASQAKTFATAGTTWRMGTTILTGNTPTEQFSGRLDEVRVYNTARTAAQIQADMLNVPTLPLAADLVAYYNFDQGTPATATTGNNAGLTTLYDLVAANAGTLTNYTSPGLTSGNTTSNWVESYALVVPTATAATALSSNGFTANWTAPGVGTVDNGYRLDVSTAIDFSSAITGSPFTVASGTSRAITGLTAGTTYYYRVRADKTSVTGQGASSNVITAVVCPAPVAVAQNTTVALDVNGNATLAATAVNNGSTINCGAVAPAGALSLQKLGGVVYGDVVEGGTLTFTAPSGAVFTSVDFASYGTPTGTNGTYSLGSCNASNSVSKVQTALLGNNSGSIGANNGVFGDPCGGTVKRLAVRATYSYTTPAAPTAQLTYSCAELGTQNVRLTVADGNGNSTTTTATVTVTDNLAPVFTACGAGTAASPFTNINCAKGVATGTYTFRIGGNTFQGYVDGTTDGGGWVEILNYVHRVATNPALNVRTTSLPVQTSAGLGTDESGSAAWGHADPTLVAAMNPLEVRFYGQTSSHSRVIHFKTSLAGVLSYLKTGTGTMSGIGSSFTPLAGHSANLPASANNYFASQGTIAATEFPFYTYGNFHWGIHGLGNRWEVDDETDANNQNTIHRIFVRGSATAVPAGAVPLVATNTAGQCGANVTLAGTQAVTDNCAATVTFSPASGSFFAVGTTTVTATATDASGNQTTAPFTVTVTDTQAPTAVAQAVSAAVDATGRAYVSPNAVNNGSTDNCTITNVALSASTFGACSASAALLFDGTNDYVSLPSGLTNTAQSFTFEAWVNYVDNGKWTRIFDFGTGQNVYTLLTPRADVTNALQWEITGTGANNKQVIVGPAMPTGWHHIALTLAWNATTSQGVGTLYLDGTAVGTNTALTLNPALLGTLPNTWLGRSQFADPYFKGQLDEVRIWSTARTAAEINLYKDKSLAGNTTGLLAYYDFNDAPGSLTVADRTAAARTGTLNGFTAAAAFQAPGQVPALGLGANTVTLTVSDNAGNVTSTTATVTVSVPTPTVATWSGSLSTDWTDCRNWQYGQVPTASISAVVPTGLTLYPVLTTGAYPVLNVTVNNGGTLTVNGPATLQVNGNYTNNGTATLSGTVAFMGSAATQTLGGSTGSGFNTVTVNKASGTVQLAQNLTINSALTLTSGTLTTGSFQVNLGGSATISEVETSYVIGKVVVNRPLVAGSAQAFSGLGLTLTPAAGSVAPGATLVTRTTGTALTGVNGHVSILRNFDIQPTVNTGLNVTMAFGYFTHELNSIPTANLALFKSVSGPTGPWAWQRPVTLGTNVVTKTGITDFSIWTLGNSASPLPVELTAFTATAEGNAAVRLSWTTASEKNSERFEVERSLSGTAFERIATVAGQGTKATATDYALLDGKLPAGATTLYYRLRQVDLDGTASYSPVRSVALSGAAAGLALYPNPAHGGATTLTGALPGTVVRVYDALGREVTSAPADATGTATLKLPAGLPTGVYLVRAGNKALRLTVE